MAASSSGPIRRVTDRPLGNALPSSTESTAEVSVSRKLAMPMPTQTAAITPATTNHRRRGRSCPASMRGGGPGGGP